MAIKLPDGRIMRTLPEQVDKNMQDIASINNEVNVIKESITTAYKIQGSATVADLNANTPDAAMNGYVYNMTDAGSLINSDESTTSVQIGDNVVLVWNDGDYFWDRLSGVVDTSNLVTLDTAQDITGNKTFKSQAIFQYDDHVPFYSFYMADYDALICKRESVTQFEMGNNSIFLKSVYPLGNASYDLGMTSLRFRNLYLSGEACYGLVNNNEVKTKIDSNLFAIAFGTTNALMIGPSLTYTRAVIPVINNYYELGTVSNKWKDFYLEGNISDGTNSVAVAQISKTKLYLHTLTVSNITPPVCVVLTSNVALSGSVGSNLGPRMIVTAYLASNYVSLLKTPNGSLIQINSDLTLSIAVSSGVTITADTVTEL